MEKDGWLYLSQGKGAFAEAVEEYSDRLAILAKVKGDLDELLEHVLDNS